MQSAASAGSDSALQLDDIAKGMLVDGLRLLKGKRRAASERVQIDRLCDELRGAERIHFIHPQDS